MENQALVGLAGKFQAMCSRKGRPSISPEKLRSALLLQVLYTISSARMSMEQLDGNLLFCRFVGLFMDYKVRDHSVFSKIQDSFLRSDLAAAFFGRSKERLAQAGILLDEHFTGDGTLIEAWASKKSFRPQDTPPPDAGSGRNPEVDFHGERRLNQPHVFTKDPEVRLFRKGKGKEAKLCFRGYVLMENRHGLIIMPRLTAVTGTAEWDTAERMVGYLPGRHRITMAGDKAYDTREMVQSLRILNAVPHVAQNCKGRESAIDGRTARHRSTLAETCGGNLRLDENRKQSQEKPTARGGKGVLDANLHGRGLQSVANTQPGDSGFSLNLKGPRECGNYPDNRQPQGTAAQVHLRNCPS
jgi:transposase